jgi:enoyl-[acyl-carrier protein] reductase I
MEKSGMLAGKKILILGVANGDSIAAGCARAFRAAGADIALTYLSEKARQHVAAVGEPLDAVLLGPCDVRVQGSLEAARVVDCSETGFLQAMAVSCHSFIRMAKLAEPLMANGGTLLTVSFYGAEKAVENYNLMGPVKAALEASMRAVAAELGGKNIRAHALSPGPLLTRAASGIDRFDELVERAKAQSPGKRLVTADEIGALAAFLASDPAAAMTGGVHYVDAGYNIVG